MSRRDFWWMFAHFVAWTMIMIMLVSFVIQVRRSTRERGDRLAKEIQYFYEPKTDLCFARNKGGGLAVVPYEQVKYFLMNPPTNPFEGEQLDPVEETTTK